MTNWDYKKLVVSTILLAYCLYYISSLDSWHFVDNVNLVIHEAGHVVFSLFGYFITIAGGTLLQLIVPLLFIGYFFWKDQKYSASVLLFWLALNLFNISVYAGDALKMQLPLLTGNSEDHDWNQMLFTLGQLKHVTAISRTIFILGIITLIVAFAWGVYESRRTVQFGDQA